LIRNRLTRRIMAVVFVILLVCAVSFLMARPAAAMEDTLPPTTSVLPLDPVTLVVALTMATVEAIKRYTKWPIGLIWLPVVILGVAFNVGYAMLFDGATGTAIIEAAKMGLWLGVTASGIFSLGKAAMSTKAPPAEVPVTPPAPPVAPQ
jgi:integral membrane sensor domain MASE1